MNATAPQHPDLMALADAILRRNSKRNTPSAAQAPQGLPCCAPNAPRARNTQQIDATALSGEAEKRNKRRNTGATGATTFAAESEENAREYIGERTAICAADGLPVTMLRPVYTCTLRENRPFTVLGRVGETLDQARADLQKQFGDQFVDLQPYRAKTAAPIAPRDTIPAGALPEHGGAS